MMIKFYLMMEIAIANTDFMIMVKLNAKNVVNFVIVVQMEAQIRNVILVIIIILIESLKICLFVEEIYFN